MTTIVKRITKGSPLSYIEMDTNLENLNTDKLELADLAPYETTVHATATYATQAALATTNANLALTDAEVATKQDALPNQTGNNGKFLGTNGSTLSWNTVDALPSQTGNAGKYLTTDGTDPSWATISSVTLNGVETLTNKTLTTPYINTSLNFVGTSGKIQVGGVDKVVIGSQGIEAGSFKPGAIVAKDLAGGSGNGNLTQYTTAVTPLPAAGVAMIHNHTLGVLPVDVGIELTCLTAEHGYSVGDVIIATLYWNGAGSVPIHNIWKSPTQVGSIPPTGFLFLITPKTSYSAITPTAANWSYRFRLRAA